MGFGSSRAENSFSRPAMSTPPPKKNTFKYTFERYGIEKKNTPSQHGLDGGQHRRGVLPPPGVGPYDESWPTPVPKGIIHLRTNCPAGSSRAVVRGALLLRRRQHYRNSTGANGRRTLNAVGRVRVIDDGGRVVRTRRKTTGSLPGRQRRNDGRTDVRHFLSGKDATERIVRKKIGVIIGSDGKNATGPNKRWTGCIYFVAISSPVSNTVHERAYETTAYRCNVGGVLNVDFFFLTPSARVVRAERARRRRSCIYAAAGRTCTMTARRPPLSIRDGYEDVSTAAAGIKPVSSRWSHTYTGVHGGGTRVVQSRGTSQAAACCEGACETPRPPPRGISRATHAVRTQVRIFISDTTRRRPPVVYLCYSLCTGRRKSIPAAHTADNTPNVRSRGSFVVYRDTRLFKFTSTVLVARSSSTLPLRPNISNLAFRYDTHLLVYSPPPQSAAYSNMLIVSKSTTNGYIYYKSTWYPRL